MSDQADLIASEASQVPAVEAQGEFYPHIDLAGVVPAYQRPEAHLPILLETRGLTSHANQLELISKRLITKESIVAKLRSVGADNLAEPLAKCHTEQSWAQCGGCYKVRTFWNRCENFYCPNCQPALARERAESIQWWANLIEQPKHVVVTVRNTDTITFARYKWFKQCLTKLRRRKFANNWRGGLWNIETTNEGKGWHVHAHLLVDAHWIDPHKLAQEWADIVGQDFAIVWVRDARGSDYLREVTKYTVKSTMLAAWTPEDIVHFVNAASGQRMFGVFGTLYGKRTEWRKFLDTLTIEKGTCECGCNKWQIFSEAEWLWRQETLGPSGVTKPNAPPKTQLDLLNGGL